MLKSKENHFSTIPPKMITKAITMVLGMQCHTLFNKEVVCSYTYADISGWKYSVGNKEKKIAMKNNGSNPKGATF